MTETQLDLINSHEITKVEIAKRYYGPECFWQATYKKKMKNLSAIANNFMKRRSLVLQQNCDLWNRLSFDYDEIIIFFKLINHVSCN